MITFYKKQGDHFSNEIEHRLKEMVLAFKTVESRTGKAYIQDDEKLIKDRQQIDEWLTELEKDLTWQRSLSGDGCYIDPDSGEVC